jgi:hypothetical protein
MGEEKINTNRFKAFLQIHPAIAYSRLEKEAGVPHDLLKSWMAGRQKMKEVHYLKLLLKCSSYSDDPWMIDEARSLYNSLKKAGKLNDVKFK